MDYEKFTFRIHEYCLRADCCKSFLNVIGKFFMIYVFVSIPFFLYGNYAFIGTNTCLGPLMANYTLDFNSSMNQTDGQNIIQAQDIVQVRLKDTVIINNGSSVIEYEFAIFQFSGADYIVTFGRDDKIAHGFKYHDFAVDISCYASSSFGRAIIATMLDFNVIMMNEIMTSMDGFNMHLRNMLTNQYFRFSNAQIQGIKYFSHSITWPFDVFFNIVQILCGLFVAFTATALSIRILFQYIPAWIFYLIRRSPRILQQVIRHYSWIGIYFHTLQINGRSFIWILISLLMFSELFSRLRDVVQLYWQFLLFDKATPMSLINRFYDLVLSIEILTFLFVRTRTSLKYLPRITIMIMLIFFYYFQHTVYGFYERAFYMMEYSIYAAFCYFLLTFELEALDWDPTHHYTPSPEKPRTLYFPTFSLTWIHDIPPLWTMFYPLFGKSHFSERELSLVNGNYELLSQVLQESQQRAAGGEEGLNIGLLNNNQVAIEIPPINQGNSPNMTQQNLMQNEE